MTAQEHTEQRYVEMLHALQNPTPARHMNCFTKRYKKRSVNRRKMAAQSRKRNNRRR